MIKGKWEEALLASLAVLLLVVATVPTWVSAAPLRQNLLTNPGFEPPYNGSDTTYVANGWNPWHEDSGDLCNTRPEDWNFVCRPHWMEERDWSGLGFIRSGSSQHIGIQYMTWHAGVFQTVNVPAGARVRFTVWGRAFAANENPPAPSYGVNWVPHMQVGIDPNGDGLWTSPAIIWSGENNTLDAWVQLSVEATVGPNGRVSVFTSSRYRAVLPVAHMETWWEDASLEVITPPATVAPTSPPRPTNPAAPVATSTPRPDGAIVHVVQYGDTLSGIAQQYGVPLEQIIQLNSASIGAGNVIVVGQELVISLPAAPPTTPPQPTPIITPTVAPTGGSLCVLAFHDRNGDTFREPDAEEMLPNALFTVGSGSGIVGQYTTDGLSEPYCFVNLPAGTYRVNMQPPPGYVSSGPADMVIGLTGGQLDVVLGAQRGEPPTATPTAGEGGTGGGQGSEVLQAVARVSGIILLALAIVVAVVFFLARRRR